MAIVSTKPSTALLAVLMPATTLTEMLFVIYYLGHVTFRTRYKIRLVYLASCMYSIIMSTVAISTGPTLKGARLEACILLLRREQIPHALAKAPRQGPTIALAQWAMKLMGNMFVHMILFLFVAYLRIHYINDPFQLFLPLQERTR
jgi:hypothetical protein